MHIESRGLREATLRAFAGLGLVLALAVMAVVFAVSATQGGQGNKDLDLASSDAPSVASDAKRTDPDGSSGGPSAIGVMLGVLVLGTGVTVLAMGARRPEKNAAEPDLVPLV